MNEIQLIQALQQGDKNAFSFLVQTYQHMVFNTVLSIVQQQEEAEDVAQEVFVQAFISITKFRGDSKISTWLYRIAVTKALDHQRKKKSKKRFGLLKNVFGIGLQEEMVADFYHPGVQLENKEKSAILFKALQNLPSQQRVAFTLIKIEGLNYEDTSIIMQISIKAIESFEKLAAMNGIEVVLCRDRKDFLRKVGKPISGKGLIKTLGRLVKRAF